MAVAEIKLYEQLKPKLGEAETQALLEYVQVAHEAAETRLLSQLVTKADAKATEQVIRGEAKATEQSIRNDVKHIEQKLHNEIQAVREELKADIAAVDQRVTLESEKLRSEIQTLKADLTKSFYTAVFTMVALLTAIMFGLLSMMLPA